MFRCHAFIAGPIYSAANRHITGETEQKFIHLPLSQLRGNHAGRIGHKKILFFSNYKVSPLHLRFNVLCQVVADLLPAHQPTQSVAEGDGFLIRKSLQWQPEKKAVQDLAREKRGSALAPHYHRIVGMVFTGSPIQNVLNTLVRVLQYLEIGVRLMDQIITAIYAITLWQTHNSITSQVCWCCIDTMWQSGQNSI